MGITGLLPFLKDFAEDTDLTSCRGSVIAVDAYIWLYKGAYCCPYQLVCGIPTSVHIDFLVKRVHLLELGIRPILVPWSVESYTYGNVLTRSKLYFHCLLFLEHGLFHGMAHSVLDHGS